MRQIHFFRFGLLLHLIFISLQGLTQTSQITIKLQNLHDLSPVENASITIRFNPAGNDKETQSIVAVHSQKGRYRFELKSDAIVNSVEVKGSEYETVELQWEEVERQGYTIFLEPKTFDVPDVVFTSHPFGEERSRLAQKVVVIKARDLQFANLQTSGDLLQNSGEVFVQKSQMGGGSPVMRGFEANKVMIVVDGVRMNNAIYRGGHLQNVITIDQNMLERVELQFGPGSVMFGSDALGGVMNFVTKNPQFASEGKTNFGGNGYLRSSSANWEKTGHADLNFGFKQIGFLSSFTFSDFDDLQMGSRRSGEYPDFGKRTWYTSRIDGRDTVLANPNVNLQRGSAYRQYDLMQKVMFYHKKIPLAHSLNFQYSNSSGIPRYDRLTELAGSNPRFASWYYGPQKRGLGIYKATLGKIESVKWLDEARLTLACQDIEESRVSRRFNRNLESHRVENVRVYSANLDAESHLGMRHNFNYGLELSLNDVQSRAWGHDIVSGVRSPISTRYPDGGSVMRFGAVYGAWRMSLVQEKLFLSAGTRINEVFLRSHFKDKSFFPFLEDQVGQSYLVPSGSLGIVAKPDQDTRFAVQVATGFRAPNVDDIGKTFDSSPGRVIIPNPDLGPENTFNLDLSASRIFWERFEVGATGFGTYYTDAVVVRNFKYNDQDSILYDGVMSRVQANVNAGKAKLVGLSAFGRLVMTESLSMDHSFTWTQGKVIDPTLPGDSTVYLDHIPPAFGKSALRYQAKKIQAELFVLYNLEKPISKYSPSGEDNAQYATADGMPAWYTVNFKASYSISANLRLQGGVDNILDRHYRVFASGISGSGRNVYLTLRAGF